MSDSSNSRAPGALLTPLLTLGAVGLVSQPARADDSEALDEEFLDYLLQLEGEDEDWTLFDSQDSEPTPPATTSKTAPAQESPTAAKTTAAKPPASAPGARPTSTQTPGTQSGAKR